LGWIKIFVNNMQTILVAGAGKSSNYLIHYLLTNASRNKWKVVITDANLSAHLHKINSYTAGEGIESDITDAAQREALVQRADLVISILPPALHILLAKDCIRFKKHLITSSYISDEMKALDKEAREAGLMFMCEMGLDPGIDHMTASKIIHSIQRVAGSITSFKSYCGGLIAPESDDNPWHYKFTWNPKNVVTAGFGGAKYLFNGRMVEVPYERMFENAKKIKVGEVGQLAWYPNRDSMRYLDLYEVPEVKTFMRATLRQPQFMKGWNAIIALGLTRQDDAFETHGITYAQWVKRITNCPASVPLVRYVAKMLEVSEDDKVMSLLSWLELFSEKALPEGKMSSADVLLALLQTKWGMNPDDKDMVVMQHEIEYTHKGGKVKLVSYMVVKGETRELTAMAKTVGLPIGILAKLVLSGKVVPPLGVCIPTMASVYRPVLTELAHYGVTFHDEVE
jgi:saccharopine dehydrogenase-like NADP-dependent oxidoreductase